MKLYSYWRSSSSYRVRIALAYKGIPHEYVAVDISPDASQQLAPGYAAVHPSRMVPLLQVGLGAGALCLGQSVAIIEYLEERFPEPPLLPQDALARAQVREAVQVVNASIQPLQNVAVLNLVRQATPLGRKSWLAHWLPPGLATLEALARRQGGRYSVGDGVSMADAYLVPQLYAARRFDIDLGPYPTLLEVEGNCLALDAFRRAHPDRQPDAPGNLAHGENQ